MQAELLEEQAVKIAAFNGIEIYRIKSRKFKTNSINFFFHDNLSKENAAKNALLPDVLKRGCISFPTFRDISMHLESLYGASFDCGVVKKGEQQIIRFYIDFLSDTYAEKDSRQFEKALGLVYEILTKPVLEQGIFNNEYVALEKENMIKLIEGRVNDKMQYSFERCFEEMCAGEPFGIYECGSVQDVKDIDAASLSEHYKSVLESYPLRVYLTGDISDDMAEMAVNRLKSLKRCGTNEIRKNPVEKCVKNVKDVTENISVNQSKLCLGLRTNIEPGSADYITLMVCNGILGVGMHSKLFQNVREKASLAYYAISRLEKNKGLMIISAGIEAENKEKTKVIMLEQLENIKKGIISDYELNATIKTLETSLKSLKDSQQQIVDFYLGQSIAGTEDSINTIIEKVKNTDKGDVIRVSKGIMLDTVYFLTA